jgi:hypothetical protein
MLPSIDWLDNQRGEKKQKGKRRKEIGGEGGERGKLQKILGEEYQKECSEWEVCCLALPHE